MQEYCIAKFALSIKSSVIMKCTCFNYFSPYKNKYFATDFVSKISTCLKKLLKTILLIFMSTSNEIFGNMKYLNFKF